MLFFCAFVIEARSSHTGKVAIENVAAQESYVISGEGAITIFNTDEANNYYVYSITGQLIKTVRIAPDSNLTIELPQGYYIIRCQQWVRKILVK